MPNRSLQASVDAGLELLPPAGQTVEFDAFKAQLYSADPDGGRDAFAHMIKNGLFKKELSRNDEGKLVVQLSRKA